MHGLVHILPQFFNEISEIFQISQSTLKRYISLLRMTFLMLIVAPYFSNINKRLIKTPKIFLNDSGLLAYLLGITLDQLQHHQKYAGPLIENFVTMEIIKQISWSIEKPSIYHYRLQSGQEVDVLLENRKGNIVAIEIKASQTINIKAFKGIKHLKETYKKRFLRGILLYTGDKFLKFGENIYAVPINYLWQS